MGIDVATPMARDLGVSTPTIFAAFSAALIVSALLGPSAGKMIDRTGGRSVLAATSLIFALGLAGLGVAQRIVGLFAAWAVPGVGMGAGLYEAAFATLVGLYGNRSRGAITGITLIAGFASRVGWPLSSYMESHIGWRGACLAWAALHLTLGLALNLSMPRAGNADLSLAPSRSPSNARPAATDELPSQRLASCALAFVFAATWFISTAMAAHLPRLLQAGGATLATAITVGALIGPAHVGARILEFGLLRRIHPLLSARIAAALHPVGALAFGLLGAPAAALFGVLHGAGNGILTIAKGTLLLVIFGPNGYGHRQGILMVRVAQALAPWLFGMLLDAVGTKALWLSSGLGVAAILMLMTIRQIQSRQVRGGGVSVDRCSLGVRLREHRIFLSAVLHDRRAVGQARLCRRTLLQHNRPHEHRLRRHHATHASGTRHVHGRTDHRKLVRREPDRSPSRCLPSARELCRRQILRGEFVPRAEHHCFGAVGRAEFDRRWTRRGVSSRHSPFLKAAYSRPAG